MHAHDFKGLAVIAAAEGEQLGTVARIYLDPDARAITGFAFNAAHGLLQPEWSPRVDMTHVQSLGPDAVIVGSKDDVQGDRTDERFPDLVEFDDLVGRPMLTTAGESLGKVTDIVFDDQTFEVAEIEISPGRFAGRVTERIEDVVDFGGDYLMIATRTRHLDVGPASGQEQTLDDPNRSSNRGGRNADLRDA